MLSYNSEDYNHTFMLITSTVCVTRVTTERVPLLKILQPHRQVQNIFE